MRSTSWRTGSSAITRERRSHDGEAGTDPALPYALLDRDDFPDVEVPVEILASTRGLDPFAAVEVVGDFLREIHGPMPDHRDDRARWLAWVAAVEERALSFLGDGSLDERRLPA